MKYEVFVSITGLIEVDAKATAGAKAIAEHAQYQHIAWSDEWIVDGVDPIAE